MVWQRTKAPVFYAATKPVRKRSAEGATQIDFQRDAWGRAQRRKPAGMPVSADFVFQINAADDISLNLPKPAFAMLATPCFVEDLP